MVSRCITESNSLLLSYRISHRGKILEQSDPGQPIEYTMGQGLWPVQVELALIGEEVGRQLNLTLGPDDNAFGRADPERIIKMPRDDFADAPQTGQLIEFELANGEPVEGQVLAVSEEEVEVDFNHPYAGRELDFEIVIEKIF